MDIVESRAVGRQRETCQQARIAVRGKILGKRTLDERTESPTRWARTGSEPVENMQSVYLVSDLLSRTVQSVSISQYITVIALFPVLSHAHLELP